MSILKKTEVDMDEVVRYMKKKNRRNVAVAILAASSVGALCGLASAYLVSGDFRNETRSKTRGAVNKVKDLVGSIKDEMRYRGEENMDEFDPY